MPHYLSDMRIPLVRLMSGEERKREREISIRLRARASISRRPGNSWAKLLQTRVIAFSWFGDGLIPANERSATTILDRTFQSYLLPIVDCKWSHAAKSPFRNSVARVLAHTDGEIRWYRPTLRYHTNNCIINLFFPFFPAAVLVCAVLIYSIHESISR